MAGVRARQSGGSECDAHESAGAAALQFAPFEAAEKGSTSVARLSCTDLLRLVWTW